ncbi:hypothetical protein IHE33_07990 [Mycetohabitans endofungorum]|uniref:Tc toxin subunit A n=1 Tax=Mycetohabitans endofungorum TaxID=417203 RepID=UPI0030CAD40D
MEADSSEQLASLMQRLGIAESSAVRAVIAQAGSVITLAQHHPREWMRQFNQLHITEARRLHDRARSVAVAVARRFREQELGGGRRAFELRHGLHALTAGPRYDWLFQPDFDAMAQASAIESRTSPVAYLVQLYRIALALETDAADDFKIRLAQRRPDIAKKVLDTAAMNQPCRTLSIVNDVLAHAIDQYLPASSSDEDDALNDAVDTALADCRYPWRLPYEHWQEQINAILAFAQPALTLGDVARHTDNDYPYFYRKGAHSPRSDAAMQQSTGLGANRRALLIEAPYFPGSTTADTARSHRYDPHTLLVRATALAEDQTTFFKRHFGVDTLPELQRTDTFCLRTDMSRHALDELFALQTHAPTASPNVKLDLEPVDASRFGAVFINSGSQPPIDIDSAAALAQTRLTGDGDAQPAHRLVNLTEDRADRANRLIRLSRWLHLSYADTDRLVSAAIIAEQGEAVTRPWMTPNTLRALGVYQDLRQRYAVTAENFAVWLHQISPYGQGTTLSQFDRLFNAQSLFAQPLVLDDTPFDIRPVEHDERGKQTVQHICAALGLNQETFQYLARLIAEANAGSTLQQDNRLRLTRSLATVSSFYRITSLARTLKLHPIVLTALLEILDDGGPSLVNQMVGRPVNLTYQVYGYADVLSTLVAVVSCVQWCQDNDIDIVWLIQHVQSPVTPTVATDAEKKLIQELKSRLEPVRVTRTTLLEAGVPETIMVDGTNPISPDWLSLLHDLMDEQGVIRDGVSASDDAYALSARTILTQVLDALYASEPDDAGDQGLRTPVPEPMDAALVEVEKQNLIETLLAVVLRARAAQLAVVQESLAGYLQLSAERVLPLIAWAGQSAYELLVWSRQAANEVSDTLLSTACRFTRSFQDDDDTEAPESYDTMLVKLAELGRLARIAQQFQLDEAMLQAHAQSWGRDWFGFAAGTITLQHLYYLSLYARVIKVARHPPEKLLHYLKLVNDPELFAHDDGSAPSEDQLRLVRDGAAGKLAELLGWSAREILTVAQSINEQGIVFNLVEFDKLLRCYALCRTTGLSAQALLDLGALTLHSPDAVYRKAAQNALSCLTAATVASEQSEHGPVAEVGQSVTSTCTVSPEQLIANHDALDNIATFTLTIRDLAGEPLKGIVVRWSVEDAGSLQQTQTLTNEDGVTTVELQPGVIMGVARVRARIGLDQVIDMPTVLIDCDEASLRFTTDQPKLPTQPPLAGERESVELFVKLKDRYDNAGVDRLVQWTTSAGRLLQANTHTDREGYVRVKLVSQQVQACKVSASYGTRPNREFPTITFVDRPYLDRSYSLRVITSNVAGEGVTVQCRMLSLSGAPAPDQPIRWKTADSDEPHDSYTDEEGLAQFTFQPTEAGEVTVSAAYRGPQPEPSDEPLETLEQAIEVLGSPTLERITDQNVRTVTGAQPLLLKVRVQATDGSGQIKPAARYPVSWRIDEEEPTIVKSDALGESTLSLPRGRARSCTVVACLANEQEVVFNVEIFAPPRWELKLNDQLIPDASAPITFRHGQTYTLQVTPASDQGWLQDQEITLTWEGPNVMGLGLSATPPFLQPELLDDLDSGIPWEISCHGRERAQFALGIRLVGLGHVQWLKVNLLEPANGEQTRNRPHA